MIELERDKQAAQALLQKALGRTDAAEFTRMGGLTNRTYHAVFQDGAEYVVRIPGEGTEEMISRRDEEVSTRLACKLGIDAELLYFGENGAKVTAYIPGAVTMSAPAMREPQHIREAADILRRLHRSGEDTGIPFEVFSMAASYEKIIADKQVPMFSDYAEVKAEVMAAKRQIDAACDIVPVPCHNDVLCENWVVSDAGKMYLIDWEYAGMNDGIWDVADLSIEAVYDHALDEVLLRAYLGREPETMDWKHFLANKLYVDYLWTLWAKARVPYDGQPMEDWAAERYARLKKNLLEFQKV